MSDTNTKVTYRVTNHSTVTDNILQMKTFVHLLGSRTKRAILSGEHRSILPPRVPNHSAGFRSCGPLAEFAI